MVENKKLIGPKSMFGHPSGLYVLFFTELWERFSYYGMRALFTLFLVAKTDSENPGFGWTNSEAIALYGWYTMLVYLSSLPGGWIADKILGQSIPAIYSHPSFSRGGKYTYTSQVFEALNIDYTVERHLSATERFLFINNMADV